MKRILLTGLLGTGRYAIVDDEDYQILGSFKWYINSVGYACRSRQTNNGHHNQTLHSTILEPVKGMVIDHINGDKLDNRKENLRVCTISENTQNQRKRPYLSSKYLGVRWHKRDKVWIAKIAKDGKGIHLGTFRQEELAARMYDSFAKKLYGKDAKVNFPAQT